MESTVSEWTQHSLLRLCVALFFPRGIRILYHLDDYLSPLVPSVAEREDHKVTELECGLHLVSLHDFNS